MGISHGRTGGGDMAVQIGSSGERDLGRRSGAEFSWIVLWAGWNTDSTNVAFCEAEHGATGAFGTETERIDV